MILALLTAALLGLIEGVTEFLPVSSTGHLILFADLFGFEGPPGHVFEIVIQLAAILAVVALFWPRLIGIAQGVVQGRRSDIRLTITVALAFLPAAVLGAVLHDFIKNVLFTPWVVCAALIGGGIVLMLIDRLVSTADTHRLEDIGPASGLKIGFLQCLAMIPGVSRSGATIIGGMVLGLDKRTAAEFSFFLAIPTMFGATAYDLYKNWHNLGGTGWLEIAVGSLVAFLSAVLVIRTFLTYLSRHGFFAFGVYRVFIGLIFLIILLMK